MCYNGVKTNIEYCANTKICFKIAKNVTEAIHLIKKYTMMCLSHNRVHEWYTRFKDDFERLNGDQHVDQSKFMTTKNAIKTEYFQFLFRNSTHFYKHQRLRKLCSSFVPIKLTDGHKFMKFMKCGVFNMIQKPTAKVPHESIEF